MISKEGALIPQATSNLIKAAKIIDYVLSLGATDFCLCAGARNSPFITILDENKIHLQSRLQLYHLFDERAAGFFALGCSQRTQKPVVIITTSGTAVSELLSAAVEAYYTKTPLIFITADRPPNYRGTGAPQTIEQIGIFSHYSRPTIDITDSLEDIHSFQWSRDIPLHLNVCFSEPLLEGPIPYINIENIDQKRKMNGFIIQDSHDYVIEKPQFFSACKHPLFIISGLNSDEKDFVVQQLTPFPGLFWIEALSRLRGHPHLESRRIKSGYPFLTYLIENKKFDGIIRIGSVPTTRLWRDLEDKYKTLPVLSLSENSFSGLARPSEQRSLTYLKMVNDYYKHSIVQELEVAKEKDDFFEQELIKTLASFPNSQLNLVRKLSLLVGEQPLYLGNSLPIREWDMVAEPILSNAISGNRGANGIDGQISTFFGWRSQQTHSWALLGDLTTLYDLNAPWILSQQASTSWTLAVMNNSGGQIFKPMFKREAFLNRHSINFEYWAKMWNLSYSITNSLSEPLTPLPQVLEIVPSEEQDQKLNLELEQLWKKL